MNAKNRFLSRRERLHPTLRDAVLILPAKFEGDRTDDGFGYYTTRYGYEYWRQDSDFLYLTGISQSKCVLVITGKDEIEEHLFHEPRNAEHELWFGERMGAEQLGAISGITRLHPLAELDDFLAQAFQQHAQIHYPFGADMALDTRILGIVNRLNTPRNIRNGMRTPASISDPRKQIHEQRKLKDAVEQAHIRECIDITANAFDSLLRNTRPGLYEYELEADIGHTFRRHGAANHAYNPIVASGGNACCLHYTANNCAIRDGDLILVDVGCEKNGYNADITRSFPANGRFLPAQREIYQIVLDAQLAAIAAIRPGTPLSRPFDVCAEVISCGLLALGLLQGTLHDVLASKAYKRFFMHGSGHFIGLDTHDVGAPSVNGQEDVFRPGMVTTVEPGIYIRPADDVPECYWHLGVRIEDIVLVTSEGNEVLSKHIPKQIHAVELAMQTQGDKA